MDANVSGVVGNANSTISSFGTVPARVAVAERPVVAASTAKSEIKATKLPTPEALQQAVDKANKALQTKAPNELAFSVDKGTGSYVVKMIDQQTGKVIRQIPSQEMLDIANSIGKMNGAVIKQQA